MGEGLPPYAPGPRRVVFDCRRAVAWLFGCNRPLGRVHDCGPVWLVFAIRAVEIYGQVRTFSYSLPP